MPGCSRYAPPSKAPKWDGIDLWPFITGKKIADENRTIYTAMNIETKNSALRAGDWKIIVFGDENAPSLVMLFNMAADPGESKDLAPAMPGKVAEMLRKLQAAAKNDNDSVAGKTDKP